jgi:hypothetical protein
MFLKNISAHPSDYTASTSEQTIHIVSNLSSGMLRGLKIAIGLLATRREHATLMCHHLF